MSYKIGNRRASDITSGTLADARISSGSVAQHVGDLALDDIGNPDAARTMNSQKITGLADPTAAQDAATKAYVDSVSQGLSPKESVRCAATSDLAGSLSGTTFTASANGALSIDGVTPSVGDRVLLQNQDGESDGDPENGVYTVTTVGDGSNAAVLERADDFDSLSDINGAYFFVEEGTSNAHKGFIVSLPDTGDSFTLGTTAIKISSFAGVGSTINNSNWSGADLAVANGGTGASTASGARTNLGLAIGSDVQAYDADLAALAGCQSGAAAAIALLTSAEVEILDGATVSTAELNILDGVTATAAELNILDGVTATAAELNILDGVTSTAAELNILDGVTSTAAELSILDGDTSASSVTLADADRMVINDDGTMKQVAVTAMATYIGSNMSINNSHWSGADLAVANGGTGASSASDARTNLGLAIGSDVQAYDADLANLAGCQSGASAALAALTSTEVEILDGATVSTAELNILDGVTSTTAELNILDGVTATAAELNILDGVTATAAELNITDGLTASTSELNILDYSATGHNGAGGDPGQVLAINYNGSAWVISWVQAGKFVGEFVQSQIATKTSGTSYTIDSGAGNPGDHIIALDMASINAAFTVTLQSGRTLVAGRRIVVKDTTGGCTSSNKIILDSGASNTIDGSRTFEMTDSYAAATCLVTTASGSSTGNKWSIV